MSAKAANVFRTGHRSLLPRVRSLVTPKLGESQLASPMATLHGLSAVAQPLKEAWQLQEPARITHGDAAWLRRCICRLPQRIFKDCGNIEIVAAVYVRAVLGH